MGDLGQRPVDEEQVDVVELEIVKRPVECAERVVVSVVAVVELGGHEDVFAFQTAFANRVPDPLLVAVHLCHVDVSVAHLESRERCLLRVVRGAWNTTQDLTRGTRT